MDIHPQNFLWEGIVCAEKGFASSLKDLREVQFCNIYGFATFIGGIPSTLRSPSSKKYFDDRTMGLLLYLCTDGLNTMTSTTAASTSPRFGYWVAFFIFSVITLGATIEAVSVYQHSYHLLRARLVYSTIRDPYDAVLKTRAPEETAW